MSGVERWTHFVGDRKAINESLEKGTPVKSICGKLWVTSRDPNRFPLCPECVEALRVGWAA